MRPLPNVAPGPLGTLRLAAGVHGVAVDDDMVFLDVRTGRYALLADAARRIAITPDGQVAIGDADLAGELQGAALIAVSCEGARPPRPSLPAATASALRWTYPAPRVPDLVPLGRAVADVLAAYRGRAFGQILAAAGPAPGTPVAPTPQLLAAVDRFHRWVPFAPLSAKCLLRAFVLRRHLARQGLAAHWVFGVATWPFSAHCWLQAGSVVLDDTVERVSRYTPILVA